MSTYVHRSWANVTLAEYDALEIMRHEAAEDHLNAYWDELQRLDPFNDGPATRLTDEGRTWLRALRHTYHHATDDRQVQDAATDFVRRMGLLATVNVAKTLRRERVS